jgi:hypothetical protein
MIQNNRLLILCRIREAWDSNTERHLISAGQFIYAERWGPHLAYMLMPPHFHIVYPLSATILCFG